MNTDPTDFAQRLRSGERRALARALSCAESTLGSDQEWLQLVFDALAGGPGASLRIGITGVPGVGKSTLIEALGLRWIAQGRRVAVLAVDPSSARSGGSVLADKLRMPRLSLEPNVFIRPIASRGIAGGVAAHIDESARLCEVAGFDTVVVETVGVGQNEAEVADLCDVLALLVLPGAGDEIQALKRGVTEVADLVVVNKADGAQREAAQRAARYYQQGLAIVRSGGAQVHVCSALDGSGLDALAAELLGVAHSHSTTDVRASKRRRVFRRTLERYAIAQFWSQVQHWPGFGPLVEAVGEPQLTLRAALAQIPASLLPTSFVPTEQD